MARLLLVAVLLVLANADFYEHTTSDDAFDTTAHDAEETTTGQVSQTTTGKILKTSTAKAKETSTAKAKETTTPKVVQTSPKIVEIVDLNCNFDINMCGWKRDKSTTIPWEVGSYTTRSIGTGPIKDHTTGSGQYLYIEGSSPAKIGDYAVIKYQFVHAVSQGCLSMYYHMRGDGIGTLKVIGQEPSGHRQSLWSLTGEQGNKWLPMNVLITTDITEVLIKAVRGRTIRSDIAIDDITFSNSPCPAKSPGVPVSTKSANCTFEADTCGWQQSSSDDMDWIRNSGLTSTFYTGPSGDHTSGDGYYMYLETSSGNPLDSADLIYWYPKPSSGGCFSVWYHMYGSDIGTLSISAGENFTNLHKLWSKSGEQGDQWKHLYIPLKNQTSLIKITASEGSYIRGDIAIDDISISTKSCDAAYPINCTFERSLCGWTQDNRYDTFDWSFRKGDTASSNTGPSKDHTTGTGYYLYIEASSKVLGDNASIEYTFTNPVISGCLSFYYHMYGEHTSSLNVSGLNAAGQSKLLWSKRGEQGQRWQSASISVTTQLNKIQITADTGYSYTGDIAIDDVTFSPKACQSGSTTTQVECPVNFTTVVDPQTNLGLFELSIDGTHHRLSLPVGKYPYEFVTSSGLTCHFPIYIYDAKMKQRLAFEANYKVDCDLISQGLTMDLIMTSAQSHNTLITKLCTSECHSTAALTPEISCSNDVLVVRWPTDTFYPPKTTFLPPDVASSLSKRIQSQGTDILRITVATVVPPVIYPQLGIDGATARVVLQPYCTDGSKYDPTTNRCG